MRDHKHGKMLRWYQTERDVWWWWGLGSKPCMRANKSGSLRLISWLVFERYTYWFIRVTVLWNSDQSKAKRVSVSKCDLAVETVCHGELHRWANIGHVGLTDWLTDMTLQLDNIAQYPAVYSYLTRPSDVRLWHVQMTMVSTWPEGGL